MQRKKVVVANWKMNTSPKESEHLVSKIVEGLSLNASTEIILAPPFLYLERLLERLKDTPIQLAAQNAHQEDKGAFTGEISSNMLRKMGIRNVILGHSERRSYFKETDELLARKVSKAIQNEMSVIFCVGENLEDRTHRKHFEVVREQLCAGIFHLNKGDMHRVRIAYEPVWAIGTGKTADKEQAQEMHVFLRNSIAEAYGIEAAQNISIIYGGSCNTKNAEDLFSQPDIDGGLIGGASLEAESFLQIIAVADVAGV